MGMATLTTRRLLHRVQALIAYKGIGIYPNLNRRDDQVNTQEHQSEKVVNQHLHHSSLANSIGREIELSPYILDLGLKDPGLSVDLQDLWYFRAREILFPSKAVILVQVPYRLIKSYRRVQRKVTQAQ